MECRKHSRSQLCGSIGFRLDCVTPGAQVTTGLGFFLHSIIKVWVKLIVLTPCPQAYIAFLQVPSGIVYMMIKPIFILMSQNLKKTLLVYKHRPCSGKIIRMTIKCFIN